MNSARHVIQQTIHASHVSLFPPMYWPYPGDQVTQYIGRDDSLHWPLQHMYWKIWSTP